MATSTITRPYHGKVMYLNAVRPMSDEERNRDFAYGITMMVLFLIIPLLGAGVAATTGNTQRAPRLCSRRLVLLSRWA